MKIFRTRFKKEIITEVYVPTRPSHKVIIFCQGMPSASSKKEFLTALCQKGYWVLHPRYRGSWESPGKFLQKSPHQDVLDIIDEIFKGFTSIEDKVRYRLEPKQLYIIGSSFGGPAVLLASRDERIDKVVAIAPVVDWQAPSKKERLDWLYGFVKEAFGEAYRMNRKDWDKLKSGKFYNPVQHIKELDKDKIMIVHAKDDEVVLYKPVEKFAKKLGCQFVSLKKGGHLSGKIVLQKNLYKKIKLFLNS